MGPSPEEILKQKEQKLKILAELKSELGLDKLELEMAGIRNSGKVQPLQGSSWKGILEQSLNLIATAVSKYQGSSGDGGLSNMLMQDALEWNRISKAILMRGVAKSMGINLPEHRIVRG